MLLVVVAQPFSTNRAPPPVNDRRCQSIVGGVFEDTGRRYTFHTASRKVKFKECVSIKEKMEEVCERMRRGNYMERLLARISIAERDWASTSGKHDQSERADASLPPKRSVRAANHLHARRAVPFLFGPNSLRLQIIFLILIDEKSLRQIVGWPEEFCFGSNSLFASMFRRDTSRSTHPSTQYFVTAHLRYMQALLRLSLNGEIPSWRGTGKT